MLTPFEAALVNSQVEAGMVEILASTAFPVTLSAVNPTPPNEEIVLLDVNKNPKQMLMALSEGKPLRACRDALANSGHNWRLINGSMVFVQPWRYLGVMRALVGRKLEKSEVIVYLS